MADYEFIGFVEAMDQRWREGRFGDLNFFLAAITQVVDSYRQFTHARVDSFSSGNF